MGNPGSTRSSLKARLPIALALIALLGLLTSLAEARVDYPEAKIVKQSNLQDVLLDQPQVAVDAKGNATVVWRQARATVNVHEIRAARHGANGVNDVRDSGSSSGSLSSSSSLKLADQPQVAVDAAGTATVVWQSAGNAGLAVEARQIDPDGKPGDGPATLAGGGDIGTGVTVNAFDPQVAVNSDGNPTVVWWEVEVPSEGTEDAVGKFQDCITGTDGQQDPGDPECALTLVEDLDLQGREPIFAIKSTRLASDGKEGPVRTIVDSEGTGLFFDQPQVAVHEDGRATVVWRHFAQASSTVDLETHFTIRSLQLDAGGNVVEGSPIQDVSGEVNSAKVAGAVAQTVGNPQVAVDATGRALVVWERPQPTAGANQVIDSRRLNADDGSPVPRGGQDEGQVVLNSSRSQTAFSFDPQVAVDSAGNATVVWQTVDYAGRVRIESRRLQIQAGGNLGSVRQLSDESHVGLDPQVAVDGQGRATAVWQNLDPLSFDADSSTVAFTIQAVRFNPQGEPGDAKALPASGSPNQVPVVSATYPQVENAATPQVAVHSQGQPEVVWAGYNAGGGINIPQPRSTILTARGLITAPEAQITSGPSGTIGTSTATFAFTSDTPGSTFQCELGGAREPCTSPHTYTSLPNDTHTFRVHAVDNEGDAGGFVSRKFTVDATPPAPAQAQQPPPPPPAAEPPPRIELPPLEFEFLRVKRNAKRGVARLVIEVPGPGLLVLRRNKRVRPFARQAEEAGQVALRVRPRGKARRQLMSKVRELKRSGSKGRARTKVRARVTFRPEVGDPVTQATRVRIVRRVG